MTRGDESHIQRSAAVSVVCTLGEIVLVTRRSSVRPIVTCPECSDATSTTSMRRRVRSTLHSRRAVASPPTQARVGEHSDEEGVVTGRARERVDLVVIEEDHFGGGDSRQLHAVRRVSGRPAVSDGRCHGEGQDAECVAHRCGARPESARSPTHEMTRHRRADCGYFATA